MSQIMDTIGKIKDALRATGCFKTVKLFHGDIKKLFEQPGTLPAAHIIYSKGHFDSEAAIGSGIAPTVQMFTVVIVGANFTDAETSVAELLQLVERVRTINTHPTAPGLTDLNTGVGRLWPYDEQLLLAEGGKSAYGVRFTHEIDT